MHAIEVRGGGVGDKELTATGVWASMGHGEGAGAVALWVVWAKFAIDFVAGATGARHASGTFTAVWAAALDHKVANHAMESETIVKTFFGKFDKVGNGIGGGLRKEVNADKAMGVVTIATDMGILSQVKEKIVAALCNLSNAYKSPHFKWPRASPLGAFCTATEQEFANRDCTVRLRCTTGIEINKGA